MQRDIERETELLRIESERTGDGDEVRGRAHRKELGEALNEAEDDRGRHVAHRSPSFAAASAACASRSWPRMTSSCLAHARRWPASRKRIATDPSNGPVPTFAHASATYPYDSAARNRSA